MPKTPDEIKKGLEHCSEGGCNKCPYERECTFSDGFSELAKDALEIICQYENELLTLQRLFAAAESRANLLEEELEAATEDMTKIVQKYGESYCEYCGNWERNTCPPYCRTHSEGFKWRGVQKED